MVSHHIQVFFLGGRLIQFLIKSTVSIEPQRYFEIDSHISSSRNFVSKKIRLNPREDSGRAPTHWPSTLFRKSCCKLILIFHCRCFESQLGTSEHIGHKHVYIWDATV